ncbi:hypothetical protein J2W25_006175 [Variovorax boronicumulans]|uniref:Uncharacterized protein n=1 Tax=Variovorax boronicumulans TaxID=436515 RepID=A0AAW8E6F1_9BURK|nr:hypothetical protein [Variovorax boronicumulans]MDP9927124.1 hypothetical protein [Variovorax boronicumulans]
MVPTTTAVARAAMSTEESFQHAHVFLPCVVQQAGGNVADGDEFPQACRQWIP